MMSLHFNVLQGSMLTIIIMSHTDTHPHLFISSTNLIKKQPTHTPVKMTKKSRKS